MKSTNTTIGGRPAIVSNLGRVRRPTKGWGYYNLMSIHFTDTGEYHSMGAGEFTKLVNRLERLYRQKETTR